jgi:hypothetical protein
LLTAVLNPDTPLPATITLPLPPEADLHVVARIGANGQLADDVLYTWQDGQLTFTLPARGFRVEYYLPHPAGTADQRTIEWAWQFPFDVAQMSILAQEPASAEGFQISPTAIETRQSANGLRYHTLAPRPLLAGERTQVQLRYNLVDGRLTRPPADAPTAVAAPAESNLWADNWPLFLLGTLTLILSLLLIRQGLQERRTGARPPRKPRPAKTTATRFCRHCGQPLTTPAKFCPHCGKPV